MQINNSTPSQITSPPVEAAPSQPPVQKKNFPKWIVVTMIILLLGVIGMFAYQNYLLKQQVNQAKTVTASSPDTANPAIELSPTSTSNPTEN